MAHPHSSLTDGWKGLGSYHAGKSVLPNARAGNRSGISPEAWQRLEDASTTNLYPVVEDIGLTAYQSRLDAEKVHYHYATSGGVGSDAGPHYHPEHSYPANGTRRLDRPGPVSVESDIQFNSSWLDNESEAGAEPGFFGNSSIVSSGNQHSDALNYATSDHCSYRIAKDSPFALLSDQFHSVPQLEDLAVDPWSPWSRLEPHQRIKVEATDYSPEPVLDLEADDQFRHQDAHGYPEDRKTESVTESVGIHTVSSEVAGSTKSRTKYTSGVSTVGDITTCPHCNAPFSGRYGRGNCSRHIRQHHSGITTQLNPGCICRICKKSFKRQDARRKHEWKRHELHDTKPRPRRQIGTQDYEPSHAGTYETQSDQGTLTYTHPLLEDVTGDIHYRIPSTPHQAHEVFAKANAELNDKMFDLYCQIFLARCGQIVEDLQYRESNLYNIFYKVLHDLSIQVLPEQPRAANSITIDEGSVIDAENNGQPNFTREAGVPRNKGKAPVRRRASAASSIGPYAGRTAKKSSADPMITIAESSQKAKPKEFDCPIHKYHLEKNRVSPCNGCGKPYMNGVRQHLLPTYSQQHQGIISFLQRCGTCTEDIIDQNIWNSGGHAAGTCPGRSQAQGDGLMCWARLYLKIYPDESRIPSPYRNVFSYIPDNLVASIRSETQLRSTLPQPFVVNNQQVNRNQFQASNPAYLQWPENGLEEEASLNTLISSTTNLLAQLLAENNAEVHQGYPTTEEVEAEYRRQLDELRQASLHQMQANQPDRQHIIHQARPRLPALHEAQGPIIGGADFTLPTFQMGTNVDMTPIPSDMGTQPSSQDYYQGEISFGFPSFVGSSRTSYDFGPSTLMDQSQHTTTQFHTPLDCPPSPHTGLGLSSYDTTLDMPGSSQTPQFFADPFLNAQMMSDIDQTMEASPSESYFPSTHGDFGEDMALPDFQ
ncbi:hypothetical protein GQ44DRAFT_724374 [Phaeosphaeriaceae sp. PMI808]|nr:hypothetical protein GQ44DRAFT_724374 [Phaeosphaeriaceae sp. PMI808]